MPGQSILELQSNGLIPMQMLDLYCEGTGPGLLVETWNTIACFGFLLSAVLIFRISSGFAILRVMAWMTLLLFLTATALHIYPTYLTLGLELAAILAVVLSFFFGLNRDILGLSVRASSACTLLVLPLAALSLPLVALVPGAGSSAAYAGFPVLMLGYGVALRPLSPAAARGLLFGALLLIASLVFRSLDDPLCADFSIGTHFLWIIGCALLLWHLARVYHSHMLAARDVAR
jgi:hypothetical protein